MTLDPVAVALKFGFIAVLYLFLLWMARSALKDLRSSGRDSARSEGRRGAPAYEDATGMHVAVLRPRRRRRPRRAAPARGDRRGPA